MLSSGRKLLVTGALFALLGVASGCEPIRRAGECRELAATVNTALAEVEGIGAEDTQPPKLRAVARRYELLSQELTKLEFSKEETTKDVAEYRRMLNDTVAALRGLADATDRKDEGARIRGRQEVERHARRERLLVAKIDAYCTSHF